MLSRYEISVIPAGVELDYAIAEHIMGWTKSTVGPCEYLNPPPDEAFRPVPRYSTKIAAAWEVVDKMNSLGFTLDLSEQQFGKQPRFWFAEYSDNKFTLGQVQAPTAPEAIGRAALVALGKSQMYSPGESPAAP